MPETEQESDLHCRFNPQCRHYSIIRHYRRGGSRMILTGLTLAEAQAHCSDPETSSSTAVGKGRRITRRVGTWFDGYTNRY